MYIYMCIYMYIYMCIYMYIYVYIHRISCPFLIRGKHQEIINIRDPKYRHENREILMDAEENGGNFNAYVYI
jgi:hypothetical protein